MPKFERYTPEEAQEEAGQLQEKVKSADARNYNEAEHLVEQEKRVEGETAKKEEPPKPGELKVERHKWTEFTGSVRALVSTLAERESQRTPLIDMRGLGSLAGSVNQLESLVNKGNVKAEDFNAALRGIVGGLKSIGEVPRSQGVREDEDGLTQVHSRLRRLRNDIDTLRGSFSGDQEAIGGTSALMGSLIDATEGAGHFVARRRQAWREYLGR